MHRSLACLLLFALAPATGAAPRMNQKAEALARKLHRGKMDRETGESHFAEVRGRLIALLVEMESSARGPGPPPKDLLKQGYALRSDVSNHYATMAISAIADAWEQARSLGLFDASGEFQNIITKGPDAGKPPIFQYIVPVRYVPEFSRSLCNIEIVEPRKQRTSDEASDLDSRTIGLGRTLRTFAKQEGFTREAPKPMARSKPEAKTDAATYDTARTRTEFEARWAKLRKADPSSATRVPRITVRAQRMSTPGKKNGGKFIYRFDLDSQSSFPTEVTLDYCFVGKKEKSRDYCRLLRKTETIKFLPGGSREFEVGFATPKSDYRGYAAVISFNGTPITFASSDARMRDYASLGMMDSLGPP